jgi:hypothetical protein
MLRVLRRSVRAATASAHCRRGTLASAAAQQRCRCGQRRRHSSATAGHRVDWLERGTEWAEWDPNPETAGEILALVGHGDVAELEARLDGRLTFGTAGIRGWVV